MASPRLLRQPRRCQRTRYTVIPCCKYLESVITVTLQLSVRTNSPLIAASSSIRLFVVRIATPRRMRSCFPYRRMHAHPPGPGFPKHDPSVKSVTSFTAFASLPLGPGALTHHPAAATRLRAALLLHQDVEAPLAVGRHSLPQGSAPIARDPDYRGSRTADRFGPQPPGPHHADGALFDRYAELRDAQPTGQGHRQQVYAHPYPARQGRA